MTDPRRFPGRGRRFGPDRRRGAAVDGIEEPSDEGRDPVGLVVDALEDETFDLDADEAVAGLGLDGEVADLDARPADELCRRPGPFARDADPDGALDEAGRRRGEEGPAKGRVVAPGDPALRVAAGPKALEDRLDDGHDPRRRRLLRRRRRPPLAQSHPRPFSFDGRSEANTLGGNRHDHGRVEFRPRIDDDRRVIGIDRRLFGWGIFFVVLGLVPLGVRAGVVPADVRWWELWPLLLIGWGLALLLRRTPAAPLGGLLVAATFGAMVGGFFAVGLDVGRLAIACGPQAGPAFPSRSGTFAGPAAAVEFDLRCGELTVVGVPGSNWSVSGTAPADRPPVVDAAGDRLTVRSGSGPAVWPLGNAESWRVELPTAVALDLSLTVDAGQARVDVGAADLGVASVTLNAGSATLDLDAARVGSLSGTVNAGSLVVRLPAADLGGSLTVNAGSIAICAPPGVGMRITTSDNPLGTYGFTEAGLVRSGNTWTNAEYATAATRIELVATANAGSITLNGEASCR